MAQPRNVMKFAGPSTFGVEAMNAWQDNENDTILFQMNSTTDADITIPALTYHALQLTIPSFTIHGATFSFDFTTHNAVFENQTFEETLIVDGVEKKITGYSFNALYNHADHQFDLQMVISYGKMPVQVTYKISAAYITPETSITTPTVTSSNRSQSVYNSAGQSVTLSHRGLYIMDGRKVWIR